MTIQSFCKYWREQRGITQREIGEKVGAHYTQVSSFERGKSISGKILTAYLLCGMTVPEGVVEYEEAEADSKATA